MKKKSIEIVKKPDNPESDQVIADSIIKLAESADRLLAGPLKRQTLLLLLKHSSGVSMSEIDKVLNAMSRLREFVK